MEQINIPWFFAVIMGNWFITVYNGFALGTWKKILTAKVEKKLNILHLFARKTSEKLRYARKLDVG